MRAGRLKKRLPIYLPTKAAGVSGAETLNLVGTFPCEITWMGGKEYQALGGTSNALSGKIVMRYVHGITTAHVGVYEGRRFRFMAVSSPNEEKRELHIMMVET